MRQPCWDIQNWVRETSEDVGNIRAIEHRLERRKEGYADPRPEFQGIKRDEKKINTQVRVGIGGKKLRPDIRRIVWQRNPVAYNCDVMGSAG